MTPVLTSNGYSLDTAERRWGGLRALPQSVRSDRDALWGLLRQDGYLYLPGLLDPEEVLRFRQFYFEKLAPSGLVEEESNFVDGRDSGHAVDNARLRSALFREVVPSPEYEEFCTQPALRGWFAWMYEADPFLHRRKIIRHTRPGEMGIGTATHAHYDLVYLREGTDRLLSAWIPLGDIPIERGPLIYLEGSHRDYIVAEQQGHRLPAAGMTADLPGLADRLDRRWLGTDFKAGDVMIHSAYMVHASLDNVDSQRILRLSTDIRYQNPHDPIDWRWQNDWDPDDGL